MPGSVSWPPRRCQRPGRRRRPARGSRSGRVPVRSSSSATVPAPAITAGRSADGTIVCPYSAARLAVISSRLSAVAVVGGQCRRRAIAAPFTFMAGASRGTTTVTGAASSRPASASAWAWLPEEAPSYAALPAGPSAERGDGVVGPAELERSGSLQRLSLAHHDAADDVRPGPGWTRPRSLPLRRAAGAGPGRCRLRSPAAGRSWPVSVPVRVRQYRRDQLVVADPGGAGHRGQVAVPGQARQRVGFQPEHLPLRCDEEV